MAGAVQLVYSQNQAAAYPGQLYGLNDCELVSGTVQTAAITPGLAVGQGTADDQIVLGGDGIYVGIATREHTLQGVPGSAQLAVGDAVRVIKRGYVWVYLATAGTKNAAVFYTDATGVISAGTASTGQTQIPGAEVWKAVGAAGMTVLRLTGEL